MADMNGEYVGGKEREGIYVNSGRGYIAREGRYDVRLEGSSAWVWLG